MSKRLFEIIDQMNVEDGFNGTAFVRVHPNFVSAQKCKAGGLVTMGVDGQTFDEITFGDSNNYIFLLTVNKKIYDQIKKESEG